MKKRLLFGVVAFFAYFSSFSQNTLTTVPPLNGGNGSGGTAFQLTVNSPIILQSFDAALQSVNQTPEIWFTSTDTIGPPNITVGNGWTQLGSGNTTGLSVGLTPVLSTVPVTLNQFLAPGIYRFYIGCTTCSVVYTTWSSANQDVFTDGIITIKNGTNYGYGGGIPNPNFHPRQWNGSITYIPAGGVSAFIPPVPDIDCFGDSTASAQVNAFGGTLPYTYLWSTGDTLDSIGGLGAGTYSVIVTDSAGDADTATVTIAQAPQITTATANSGILACFGDSNGVVSVAASGGTPFGGYVVDTTSANFAPDTGSGTLIALGDDQVSGALPLGFSFVFFDSTYTDIHIGSNGFLTFTNVGGSGCCSGQLLPNPTAQNDLIAFAWDDLFPPGGGSIDYYTAGVAPFRRWVMNFNAIPTCCGSNPNVTTQVILYETTNCIEIHNTDINGVSPATQGIENQDGTEAYFYPGRNASAWSANNDFISFCPTTPLQYDWSSISSDTVDSNLTAGVYYVTVTDANGCTVVDSTEITQAPPLVAIPTSQDVTCFGDNDGYVAINISGGLPPYSIMWNNGSTADSLGGLGADTLYATLTDSAGCSNPSDTFIIFEPPLLDATVTSSVDVTCVGGSDGEINTTIVGGSLPYNITWNPGGLNTPNINNLGAGTYNLSVIDSNGCADSATVTLVELNPLPTTDLGADTVICNDNPLTLVANPGFLYSWNLNIANNNQFYIVDSTTSPIGVPVEVIVFLTDINGCENSDSITVTIADCVGLTELSSNIDVKYYPNPTDGLLNISANNLDTRSLTITVMGANGQMVMTERVLNPATEFFKTIDLTDQASGVYLIQLVTDHGMATHRVTVE